MLVLVLGIGAPLALALLHCLVLAPLLRRYYPGISPLWAWQAVPLLAKEQLTEGEEPTFRLVYGLPKECRLEADLSVGEFIRVRIPDVGMRSYSPFRTDTAGEFELRVKRYREGRASKHLCDAAVGDQVQMSGPYPPFWVPFVRAGICSRVGLIAFGVGITEALPLARAELEAGAASSSSSSSEVRLLWASRGPQEVFDKEWLAELQDKFPQRFKVTHLFSRRAGGTGDLQGRLSQVVLQSVFGDWQAEPDQARFLVVGTKSMKRDGYRLLNSVGFRLPLLRRQPCGCCCRRRMVKSA